MIDRLRIVTLDNAYRAAADSELARNLFGELIRLRSEGYGPEYPETFLPVDKADYVIWHHLYCIEEEGKLIPVSGFRQVSLKRCDFYNIRVPLLETAESAQSSDHVNALNEIFSHHRSRDTDVVYSAGLTTRHQYRGNKELSLFIREMGAALTYADMLERGVSALVCAAILRFKTHLWFKTVGYNPLTLAGKELSAIKKPSAGDEPMLLMHLTQVSDWAKECFSKHKKHLDARIIIAPSQSNKMRKAA